MKTAFLLSLAAIIIQAHSLPQSEDPEIEKWEPNARGWQKPKPCGRPGRPACPTKPTTESTTKTTSTIRTTRTPPAFRPVPTVSSTSGHGHASTTTNPPLRPSSHNPPTFATTSSPDFTSSTTIRTTTTSRRPLPTPAHEGGMVFPDEHDDRPSPWTTTRRTTTTSSTTTTQSTTPMSVENCMQKCAVTSEYNPVCGTDGVTYSNLGRLNCARKCGVSVALLTRGPCRNNITSSTTTTSTTSVDGNKDPTSSTPSSVVEECIRKCPVTSEYNPVCGTNGVTYNNPGRLTCAQKCGVKVDLGSRGPCRSTTTTPPTTTTTPASTPAIDGDKDVSSTTPSSVVQECILRCPVTSEYNPVCGSNGVTYNNPGRLSCGQSCGVDVTLRSRGPCRAATPGISTTTSQTTPAIEGNQDTGGSVNTTSPGPSSTTPGPSSATPATDQATTTTKSPEEVAKCIRECPATHEYDPVCGSDGVTYKNMGHFNCAQSCKVDITLKYHGKCL